VVAVAYGEIVVVEQFVEGIELAITVVEDEGGVEALPAVEISPNSGIFDYESRYTAGLTTYFTPARLEPEVAVAAADLAIGAHKALGLKDVSRTDAIATSDGVVHFLEVNVSPGLTETSMLPMSVAEAGIVMRAYFSISAMVRVGSGEGVRVAAGWKAVAKKPQLKSRRLETRMTGVASRA